MGGSALWGQIGGAQRLQQSQFVQQLFQQFIGTIKRLALQFVGVERWPHGPVQQLVVVDAVAVDAA